MSGTSSLGGALTLKGLTKRFGQTRAIDNVDLDVAPGEFVSLLGPSGSGKSTILMAIAGFVAPDAGEVLLDGRSILKLTPERRAFGVVFQGYALFPHMTVAGNIEYPLKLRGVGKKERRAQLERALDLVHLGPLADRYPRQLSGGQQQRVALARALVFEPKVILLDEPLSALDKKLRLNLQLELKSLHERLGTTFVNVTHDQEEAMNMSDRIVILHEGRILQSGRPEELYNAPNSRFVADFLGRANFLEGDFAPAGNGFLSLRRGDETLVIPELQGATVGTKLTYAIRPERIRVGECDPAIGENCRVQGTIASVVFNGAQILYRVETVFGKILVIESSYRSDRHLAEGERTSVSWSRDAGFLLDN
ncbi:ABC transporter ATP-binding protein [Rhodobacteraceae bacterium NNCM2]|nr:ABC transporter ATP-binding protein [Coraliihabitans acroporae]